MATQALLLARVAMSTGDMLATPCPIVLTGAPGSGRRHVARTFAGAVGRKVVEVDGIDLSDFTGPQPFLVCAVL